MLKKELTSEQQQNQQENAGLVHKQVGPPPTGGCGCKNKALGLTRDQKLQDLYEKMKKTKYL